MRLLWLYLLVNTVTAQAGFGRSYLGNSRLCHTWNCLNLHLNLTDALPPRDQYAATIRTLLPTPWHDALDAALETCYGNRTRKYTNTCPGQALLHCTVDQLIQNCPSDSWVKADGCTPLSSVAAFSYMFSQSRYINLEENLPIERRPTWFLTNYFNTKCCDVPQLFSDATLQQCGFTRFLFYHVHEPQRATVGFVNRQVPLEPPFGKVGVRKPHPSPEFPTTTPSELEVEHATKIDDENQDPLECCDVGEFVRPEWRRQCGFQLRWGGRDRLAVVSSPPTTTTAAPPVRKAGDVRITPLPCEKQQCIYRRLGVVSDAGAVDTAAVTKLLDNLTDHRPEWARAKARVVTKCLTRPVLGYDAECPINDVLGCTADVLSENCPNAPKNDPCKHGGEVKDGITCQISSSFYRPKNRRQFCALPSLVSSEVLASCGLSWSWRLEYAPPQTRPARKKWTTTSNCKELTESTSCLLSKMGALNKYGFLDYFKMKERIRRFGRDERSLGVLGAALQATPLYGDSCGSPRKLLNVLDAMLLTCPQSKRSDTPRCAKMFREMSDLNVTERTHENVMKHLQNVFLPPRPTQMEKFRKVSVHTNALYDFGVFANEDAPPVRVIDVRPRDKPLELVPVYQRTKFPLHQVNADGVFRGAVNVRA